MAVITGGSSGIGAACVRKFLAQGWRVSTIALPGEHFGLAPESALMYQVGDVTVEDVRQRLLAQTLDCYGRIDVLVNSAGVGLYATTSKLEIEQFRRLFEVNVVAPIRLSQLVIPTMRRQGSGSIVNIGSVAGNVSLPWAAGYCASKAALHSLTHSLRRELGRDGIRVIKICPGIVDTSFRKNVLAGAPPPAVFKLNHVVTPEAVAEALVRGVESRSSRTIYVPQLARVFTAMQHFSPWLMDRYLGHLSWQTNTAAEAVGAAAASRLEP